MLSKVFINDFKIKMKIDTITFVFTAAVFYLLYALSPIVSGYVLLALFIVDFKVVRDIFTLVKHMQKTMGIELMSVFPTIPLIFCWMAYAVIQLMCVFYIFENLQIPHQWLKWIFPLVIIKSVFLIYQLGRRVKLNQLNYIPHEQIRQYLFIASIYGGVSWMAFYIEGITPQHPFNSVTGIIFTLGISAITIISSLIPNLVYRKMSHLSARQ